MTEHLDPISPDTLTDCESVSELSTDCRQLHDILALEARIQQLEEALSRCNRWAFRPGEDWPAAGHDRYEKDMALVDEALSTPAPDVSPLWRHLASSIKVARNTIEPNEPIDLYWDEFVASAKALTPELRSLIETMAKGGKV